MRKKTVSGEENAGNPEDESRPEAGEFPHRPVETGESFSGSVDSLETFFKPLSDLCVDHGRCDGSSRTGQIQDQARHARALAREFGVLKQPSDEFGSLDAICGSEHLVELAEDRTVAVKITKPLDSDLLRGSDA